MDVNMHHKEILSDRYHGWKRNLKSQIFLKIGIHQRIIETTQIKL